MEMIHKGCGGKIFLDFSDVFVVRTRSVGLSPRGISIGVLEISDNVSNGSLKLSCGKCNTCVKMDDVENIIMQCPYCRKKKSISEIICANQFPVICTDCQKVFTGKSEPTKSMQEIASYFKTEEITGPTVEKLLQDKSLV